LGIIWKRKEGETKDKQRAGKVGTEIEKRRNVRCYRATIKFWPRL